MDREAYKSHLLLHRDNWWFKGRKSILKACLDPYLKFSQKPFILDIGSGGGTFISYLLSYGEVTAVDIDEEMLGYLKKEYPKISCVKGALPHDVPFHPGGYHLITALDVLEHVDDDEKSLRMINELLNEEGFLLLTVPAYNWLWSYHDMMSHHKRRYNKNELRNKLEKAGLNVERITYFNSVLFPLIAVYRLVRNIKFNKIGVVKNELEVGLGRMGRVLEFIFGMERYWLRKYSLLFGVSILAICKKKIN